MQPNQPMMPSQPSERAFTEAKYRQARLNLLIVTGFTLINVILALVGSSTYMLFSASGPFYLAYLGRELLIEYSSMEYIGFVAAFAVLFTLPYILFWIFSKKHYGWMIAALVYFSLDCMMLLYFTIVGFDPSILLDVVFHVWVLYYLIMGTRYGIKLKKLPEDPVPAGLQSNFSTGVGQAENPDFQNTPALRMAEDVKHRILASAEVYGKHIVLRKVGKCDELVVDGVVYAEYPYPSWIVQPHTLTAYVNGMKISAGLAVSYFFISVNNVEFARAVKWI